MQRSALLENNFKFMETAKSAIKETNIAEQILKNIEEKISEIYKKLDIILLNGPVQDRETLVSSRLIENLTAIENRLQDLIEGIRL